MPSICDDLATLSPVTLAVIQPEKLLYTAKGRTMGGRCGALRSSGGRLDLKLSRRRHPHLFAGGWSAFS